MTNEPNLNEIAATVIQGQINNAIAAVSTGIRSAVAKILEVINKDLEKYSKAKVSKCSYVRTPIINRDHSTYIYELYVHTRLKIKDRVVNDDDFIAHLSNTDSVVVAGSAGSGKSMLMRHVFLKLSVLKRGKIPLFFELREINALPKRTLREFLFQSLIGANATITLKQFEASLEAGVYSLVLDGFDEINHHERREIEAQLLLLRDQCRQLQIIISSRPDSDRTFESWTSFRAVYVEPMNEKQAIELVGKLEYEAATKERFIREARDRLFKTHATFLSNPLLCIMMLVTFRQTGHIPSKRHVFYERAFDALFWLHDTGKEGVYKRKTYAALSIDEFRNCMSAFCIVTYMKEQLVFSRASLLEALKTALKLEKLQVDIENIISDMIESTCLIQMEGADYVFTHRSFQEYFAAVFIARRPAVGVAPLVERACLRQTDDVVNLAFSINRGVVEREWVVPLLREVLAIPVDPLKDPIGFLRECFGGCVVNVTHLGQPTLIIYFRLSAIRVVCAAQLYGSSYPDALAFLYEAVGNDAEKVNAAYVEMVLKRDERISRPSSLPRSTVAASTKPLSFTTKLIVLDERDNAWIKQTQLPVHLQRFRSTLEEILQSCVEGAQYEEDIFSELTNDVSKLS